MTHPTTFPCRDCDAEEGEDCAPDCPSRDEFDACSGAHDALAGIVSDADEGL